MWIISFYNHDKGLATMTDKKFDIQKKLPKWLYFLMKLCVVYTLSVLITVKKKLPENVGFGVLRVP